MFSFSYGYSHMPNPFFIGVMPSFNGIYGCNNPLPLPSPVSYPCGSNFSYSMGTGINNSINTIFNYGNPFGQSYGNFGNYDGGFSYPKFDFSSIFSYKPSAISRATKPNKNSQISTINNLSELKNIGYNADKGKKIAEEVLADVKPKSIGWCARHVSNALKRAGFSNGQTADAHAMDDVLRANNHFKEVKVSGKDLKNLPAGCIIVYEKGDNYSAEFGHIEISLGNGTTASDFVNKNVKESDKAKVFVPV